MFRSIRTLRSIPRIKDITLILAKHGFHQIAAYLHSPFSARLRRLFTRGIPSHVIQQPERLRLLLQDLGPTFVKFGQLLSTRPDLVPAPYLRELEKLQDDVAATPIEEILETIAEDLEGGVEKHFVDFCREPLASASIGQVHRATRRGGEQVVIKVRKRGLERIIDQDLQVLHLLADVISEWSIFKMHDLHGIVDAFDRSIRRELDFTHERFNIQRMRQNLRAEHGLYIPQVYQELSGNRVLTLEYLPGKKFSQLEAAELGVGLGDRIAENVTIAILQQIFEDTLYHADPHPGNLIWMPDGRIGLIDFGNIGKCTPQMRDDLLLLLYHLVKRDYPQITRMILKVGKAKTDVDHQQLMFDLMDSLDQYYGLSMEQIQLGGLINTLFSLSMRHQISMPPQYVMLGRSIMTLEGVVRIVAPKLEILSRIEPFLARVVRSRWSPHRLLQEVETSVTELAQALKSGPIHLSEVLKRAAEGRLQIETRLSNHQKIEKNLEVIGQRVPLAILGGAMMLTSAVLLTESAMVGGTSGSTLATTLGVIGFFASLLLALWMVMRS